MPKFLKKPESSTTSWPIPQPTDVLSYAYLWSHEASSGNEEASKDRPVVVVLSVKKTDTHTEVVVVPVTTRRPNNDAALELPANVKRRLGLDDRRSWIIASEVNRFRWPGPDLRPGQARGDGTPYFGKIPGKLLESIRDQMRLAIRTGRMKDVKRSD